MLQRSVTRVAGSRAATLATSKSLQPRISTRFQSTAPATIVDRGFWRSLIPKPLRKENRQQLKTTKRKEWNPATFFIVIFLLIGSMSIQMIALRSSFQRYMRQSEVKIGLLREVVEKIKNGERVDVEQALGTGNPEKEADWEEVLRAIEKADGGPKAPKKKLRQGQDEPELAKAAKTEEQNPPSDTAQATGKPSSSFANFF